MVSEQPQKRSDTMSGSTPKPGGTSQPTSGGDPQRGAGTAPQAQTDVGAQAQEVMEQTQQKAGAVVDQAKEQATSQLTTRKDQVAESLGTVAGALRESGKHLRQNEQHGFAQYADKAAERVEQFSGQLRGKDVPTMVRDLERYARRRPALFLGGAFVLGLLGARFLKSTAQREEEQDTPATADRSRQGNAAWPYGDAYDRGATGGPRGAAGTSGTGERSWSVRGREMQ